MTPDEPPDGAPMTSDLPEAALELAELRLAGPARQTPRQRTPHHATASKKPPPPRPNPNMVGAVAAANIAVACGAPGPTVLDVDDPIECPPGARAPPAAARPDVATARGRHLYFAGEARGTVSLGYGELRGHGSYVIAPPVVHPSGKDTSGSTRPHGRLPQVPALLQGERAGTAGTGPFVAPAELVKHGHRHDFLKDIAVRTVRSGITDVPTLILILTAAYETHCTKTPKAKPTEFRALAEWAAGTDIADRERELADAEEAGHKKEGQGQPRSTGARGDAPLAEHRAYLGAAGGWGPHVDIKRRPPLRRPPGRRARDPPLQRPGRSASTARNRSPAAARLATDRDRRHQRHRRPARS